MIYFVYTQPTITSLMDTHSQSDMTTASATSDSQLVVLGAVGGLLAAGAITVISVASVIIMVVVIRKHKRKMSEKGCTSM